MKQDLMKGVIDMHVHTNPDLRLGRMMISN